MPTLISRGCFDCPLAEFYGDDIHCYYPGRQDVVVENFPQVDDSYIDEDCPLNDDMLVVRQDKVYVTQMELPLTSTKEE